MMQPYQFQPGSAALVQTPGGQWIAEFMASIYEDQTINEVSNTVNSNNVRVIEFEVVGDEKNPLSYQSGSSAPYARGPEKEVELVLMRDGEKKDGIRTYYI